MFKILPNKLLQEIADKLVQRALKCGEKIIRQGEMGAEMFIVVSGQLVVQRENQLLRTLEQHDYVGERSLLLEEPRSADVTCQSATALLLSMNKETFNLIVNHKRLRDLLEDVVQL